MFGYVGTSRDDVVTLFDALKRSAREDPLAPDQKKNQHRNGWGYVLYSGAKIRHERMTDPIFAGPGEPVPDFSGLTYAIFHAREAGSKKLTGESRFQHPFRGEWEGGTIFLAHNGAMERARLATELGLGIEPGGMVDSEVGLRFILQQLRKGKSIGEAARTLESYTKANRALNLLLLEIPKKGSPTLFVKQFYKKDLSNTNERDRTAYYQIQYQKMKSGAMAVFSSSLSRMQPDLSEAQVLEQTGLVPISDLT